MSEPLPIACSLTVQALADRRGWIAQLNRAFLRESRVERNSLRLVYGAEATEKVRELVSKERECCGFLHFVIHESSNDIVLHIDAPDLAGMKAGPLFAPFLSGTTTDA
jgi:hypothetical protein